MSGTTKSIFVTLPKKSEAAQCKLLRAISLMTHIPKILFMNHQYAIQKQNRTSKGRGTVEGKDATDTIHIL